jgi:release factor glutamine methyltransferase
LFFREKVKKILDHEPFQYLLGETEFYGLTLKCDARALIPRPETEELVAWICETFKNKETLSLVDFCTGTGCIALSLKNEFSNSNIIATDISSDALDLATENASLNQLEVLFQQDDVLNSLMFFEDNSLDCIVSNPPYIPLLDKVKMEDNVLKFEPHLALFVEDDDPLIFYSKITHIGFNKLKSNAYLFFEVHEDLSKEVVDLLYKFNFHDILVKQDLQGKNRMIRAQKM